MKCDWEQFGERDDDGKALARCSRCGLQLKNPTDSPLDKIGAECHAWPRGSEWGHWAALLLEVFGLSKQRWAWLLGQCGVIAPCGCSEREAWMNTLPGRINAARNWLFPSSPEP